MNPTANLSLASVQRRSPLWGIPAGMDGVGGLGIEFEVVRAPPALLPHWRNATVTVRHVVSPWGDVRDTLCMSAQKSIAKSRRRLTRVPRISDRVPLLVNKIAFFQKSPSAAASSR
jgi:hypothetical protein